jgi:hypothetical protein
MSARALAVSLIVLLAACGSPEIQGPPGTAPEDIRRAFWKKQCGEFKPGTPKSEIETFIGKIRTSSRPREGGWRGWGSNNRWHTLYALDEDFDLFVVHDESPSSLVESVEVVGLPDLRAKIDPDLYPLVKAVHRAPGPAIIGFDPIALIRAANALHPAGKERALDALHAYHDLVTGLAHDDRMKYFLDEQRIFLVLRVLFQRTDGNPTLPPMHIGATDVPMEEGHAEFPIFPLVLRDDLPFLLVGGYGLAGKAESPRVHLRYCRERCSLRERPLAPGSSPVEIVDGLTITKEWKRVFGETEPNYGLGRVRALALAALSSIHAAKHGTCGTLSHRGVHHDADWREEAEAVRLLHPRWDPARQDFVAGNR